MWWGGAGVVLTFLTRVFHRTMVKHHFVRESSDTAKKQRVDKCQHTYRDHHLLRGDGPVPVFKCRMCNKTFASESDLYGQIKVPEQEQDTRTEQPATAVVQPLSTWKASDVTKTQLTHVCQHTYRDQHLLRGDGSGKPVPVFKCSRCSKRFATQSDLYGLNTAAN